MMPWYIYQKLFYYNHFQRNFNSIIKKNDWFEKLAIWSAEENITLQICIYANWCYRKTTDLFFIKNIYGLFILGREIVFCKKNVYDCKWHVNVTYIRNFKCLQQKLWLMNSVETDKRRSRRTKEWELRVLSFWYLPERFPLHLILSRPITI